jgi:SAM-dependent methyltransferase
MTELPEHVARNRGFWNDYAPKWIESGREDWEAEEPRWGVWRVPEFEVGLLPAELEGKDAIELGCGTGYVSSWLARRGARPVGIDNSEAQLETARRFQHEFEVEFALLHGSAEGTSRWNSTSPRQIDRAAARERLRGRGAEGDPAAGGLDDPAPGKRFRLVAALAA